MPATTMVAIDKGVAAPSAAAAHDSNSDNESPTNKEPEFVVDVMDDLQPLPPQRQLSLHQQMVHGMAAVLQRQEHLLQLGGPSLSWPEQHQEPERESDLFIITVSIIVQAHIDLLLRCGGVPSRSDRDGGAALAKRVYDERRRKSSCPILFGGFALSWLMIEKLDRKHKQQLREAKRAVGW
ncbi:hypothetical protein BS78_02G044600 [Paspalum vaginatum]|nr:hypothetical protein BS78_02G044600 [Paspalum vaginatum]KAJ1287880.1 hypothetical protein BS78_02G044600 [Paspalum vaginatum]